MRWLTIAAALALLLTANSSAFARGMGGGFGGMMAGGGGFRGGDMGMRSDGFRGFDNRGFDNRGFDNRGFDRARDFDRDHDRFHHRFHDRFHDRFFFHSFFFFGTEVFAPVPVALYPWLPYPAYVFAAAPGPSCYQYQTTLPIDGNLVPAWGTACLQPDGTWRSVS
ncbi:MAG TPA: hypothetical protein VLX85_06660 [Stellaceae bacterium]|nr:hypothetical protein [Stellaceae bacterium]